MLLLELIFAVPTIVYAIASLITTVVMTKDDKLPIGIALWFLTVNVYTVYLILYRYMA